MRAYIEIPVYIKSNAQWVHELESRLRHLHSVRFNHRYHITAVFFYDIDTVCLSEVASKIGETLRNTQHVSVRFGKIDIFRDDSGHYIVYLAPTDNAIDPLIGQLRHVAECSGANYRRDFRFHITLAKIDANLIDEPRLRNIVSGILVPAFSINLTDVKLKLLGSGKTKATWRLA